MTLDEADGHVCRGCGERLRGQWCRKVVVDDRVMLVHLTGICAGMAAAEVLAR